MRITAIIILLIISVINSYASTCLSQKKHNTISAKCTNVITLSTFNNRVDRATKLLETKMPSEIMNVDHKNIMMCLNTISFSELKKYKNDSIKNRYGKLMSIVAKKKYIRKVLKIYPKWTFNRGMGYYFPELGVELFGMPSECSMYEIV